MAERKVFQLEPVRTDGWFERIGESVGSFQALCEILGERFFAFSLITGARIVSLSVDRTNPAESLVDFHVGGEAEEEEPQRLSLARFRQRLAAALVAEDEVPPAPVRETDTEALQLHIGVRYLLLAPIFGFGLVELHVLQGHSVLVVTHDGVEQELGLIDFRRLLRGMVLEELDRAQEGDAGQQGAIDLARVADAEAAANAGDHEGVLDVLGPWMAPLSILLRTPDGQMLTEETRQELARALGILGRSLAALKELSEAEEVFRLAVQYAVDGEQAGSSYAQLGVNLMADSRPAEAIAVLRHAANLGAEPQIVWPPLSEALLLRGRLLAAFGATLEAKQQGIEDPRLDAVKKKAFASLPALQDWEALVEGD